MGAYYGEIRSYITHCIAKLLPSSKIPGNPIVVLSYCNFLKFSSCLKKEMNEKEQKREKAVKVF